ncbi:MAG: efflux RND transporter permease subunit [Verrucomicrobiota bacterium]
MQSHKQQIESGGLAQFFVEHREVSWLCLFSVLIWGWLSFRNLAQQEDPKIPERVAMLVTRFPGANASKVEQLVTKKLEQKVTELESVDEIKSQSRMGVSVITVSQRPAAQAVISQEWDKLRAKLKEVALPEGCDQPWLDTDYGNTVTLLYALTSPRISEGECLARAHLIQDRLAVLRQGLSATNRAAVLAFFPPAVSDTYRTVLARKFAQFLASKNVGTDIRTDLGWSYILVDFATPASKQEIARTLSRFVRQLAGTDFEQHPDVSEPIILIGDEPPLGAIRSAGLFRYGYRQLEILAEKLEDELKQIGSVGRVRKIGTVQEAVYLYFSAANVRGYQLTSDQVMNFIGARNAIVPSGTFRTEGQNFPVLLSGEFRTEKELLGTIVGVNQEGQASYLRDIFDVRRGYENPISYSVDILKRGRAGQGIAQQRSVLLAVEMKDGQIIGSFDQQVSQALQQFKEQLPDGVEIQTISNQPKAVSARVHQFMRCFLEAVLIVIVVSLFLMEWRSALVVALAIPLTVAMTLAGMWVFGVPLHQISIAALIMALGMLVDDPVVASDGINREMAAGVPRSRAAWLGPFRLRRPILFGTIINILAFLPLATIPGDTGAFILALPVVVTLALAASRLVSMTFVPFLGYHLLRGQKGLESGGEIRSFILFRPVDRFLVALMPRYRAFLQQGLERPWRTIGFAYGLLTVSLLLAPFLKQQFFPPAERNQFLVDIELPATASLRQTRDTCQDVMRLLKQQPEIETAAVFMGGVSPRFYYNVAPKEPAEYLAQVLVNTRQAGEVPALIARLRGELDREIAGARCVVKPLEQGPPVDAPIQIRLQGPDLDTLRAMADQVAATLRKAGGYRVHDDLGRRMPTLEIDIDQERANTLGISNQQIGRLAQTAFFGLKVTELREGDHLVPVIIRLRVEERNEADKIRALYVEPMNQRGQSIPLESFAKVELRPEFATISHFAQLRTVTVKAYAPVGELASVVLARAQGEIKGMDLPLGYKLELAGEAKELKKSQGDMQRVMAISIALIALAMVLQFNSVMKSIVVMLTVPLGLIGAFFGLTITGSPLGFMALLGLVSLAGVIVSHIIVLSDFIEEAREEGMELKQALMQAGMVRLRAVLVTVLATVGGLIPLFLTGGALWHSLCAVHIFGLLFATVLTLVLLPVLYYVFSAKLKLIK